MVMAIPSLVTFSRPWQTMMIGFINYLMVAVFAIELANWGWIFMGPQPLASTNSTPVVIQSLLPTITAAHWFNNDISPTKAPVETNGNMKLVGVFGSTNNRPGFAIFQMSTGKQLYVMLNQEVSAGTKLVGISSHEVTLSQNGISSKLILDEKAKPLEVSRIKTLANKAQSPLIKFTSKDDSEEIKPVVVIPKRKIHAATTASDLGSRSPQSTPTSSQPQTKGDNKLPQEIAVPPNEDVKYPSNSIHEPNAPTEAATHTQTPTQASSDQPDTQSPGQENKKETPKEDRKGLLELLNGIKNWLTGNKESGTQQ